MERAIALEEGCVEHFRQSVARVNRGLGCEVQGVNASAAGRCNA
jgi:hypothetical protein